MNTADYVNNSHNTSDRSLILMLALKIDAQEKEIDQLKSRSIRRPLIPDLRNIPSNWDVS
jgi:hypothetical protein